MHKAKVSPSGTIKMIGRGKLYDTPTGAAKVIVGRGTINGWGFWKYKDDGGELRKISDLRK